MLLFHIFLLFSWLSSPLIGPSSGGRLSFFCFYQSFYLNLNKSVINSAPVALKLGWASQFFNSGSYVFSIAPLDFGMPPQRLKHNEGPWAVAELQGFNSSSSNTETPVTSTTIRRKNHVEETVEFNNSPPPAMAHVSKAALVKRILRHRLPLTPLTQRTLSRSLQNDSTPGTYNLPQPNPNSIQISPLH